MSESMGDVLREKMLAQIIELQNQNAELRRKLFEDRQKCITQLTEAFEKHRAEKAADAELIETLQFRLGDTEAERNQLITDLDKSRQLCGYAHNRIIQLQSQVDLHRNRATDLTAQLEAANAQISQLQLICEEFESTKASAVEIGRCCQICTLLEEFAPGIAKQRAVALIRTMLSRMVVDMSIQTDPDMRMPRATQTNDTKPDPETPRTHVPDSVTPGKRASEQTELIMQTLVDEIVSAQTPVKQPIRVPRRKLHKGEKGR